MHTAIQYGACVAPYWNITPPGRTTSVHLIQALITVDVEIEVFLRQFVVGTVFTQLIKRFVEGGFQLGIILTQANTGTVAKVFLSLPTGRQRRTLYPQAVSGSLRSRRLHPETRHPDGLPPVRVDQIPVLVSHHIDALLAPVCIGETFRSSPEARQHVCLSASRWSAGLASLSRQSDVSRQRRASEKAISC